MGSKSITRLWFDGPISSVFLLSFESYLPIYHCSFGDRSSLCLHGSESASQFIILFQTGWFIEFMWSQTMQSSMLLYSKSSFCAKADQLGLWFWQSSRPFVTSLPYGPLNILCLAPLGLPHFVFAWWYYLLVLLSVTVIKKLYIKKYKEWLQVRFLSRKDRKLGKVKFLKIGKSAFLWYTNKLYSNM